MSSIYTKRLTKELRGKKENRDLLNSSFCLYMNKIDLNKNPPEGVVVEEAENLKK